MRVSPPRPSAVGSSLWPEHPPKKMCLMPEDSVPYIRSRQYLGIPVRAVRTPVIACALQRANSMKQRRLTHPDRAVYFRSVCHCSSFLQGLLPYRRNCRTTGKRVQGSAAIKQLGVDTPHPGHATNPWGGGGTTCPDCTVFAVGTCHNSSGARPKWGCKQAPVLCHRWLQLGPVPGTTFPFWSTPCKAF